MTLATDILKRQPNLSPPVPRKPAADYVRVAAKPKKTRPYHKPQSELVEHDPNHIPGVAYEKGQKVWIAYFYDGTSTIRIGRFYSQGRAHLALRLFKHWRKRGMADIPTTTSRRPYAKRP